MKYALSILLALLALAFPKTNLNAQVLHGESRAAAWDSLQNGLLSQKEFDARFSNKHIQNLIQATNNGLKTGIPPSKVFPRLQNKTPRSKNRSETSEQNRGLVEDCTNEIDDDGDGYVDCYDSDCECLSGEDCFVDVLPSDFKARLAWLSDPLPSVTATPMVINMNENEDNMPEIIVPAGRSGTGDVPNYMLFYKGDGSNFNDPNFQLIPGGFQGYPGTAHSFGDMNGDGIVEMAVASADGKVHIFTNYTERQNDPMDLWLTSGQNTDDGDGRVLMADFNGDGVSELYFGNQIFKIILTNPNNPILSRIIDGNSYSGQAHYNNWSEGSCNPTAVDILTPADCGGDPDCNGLELVAGPVIYSIDVDNTDGDGYQIKEQKNINSIENTTFSTRLHDGYTAAADMDLDGELDIIVSSRRGGGGNTQYGVYVWNKNGLLGFFEYPNAVQRSGSLACIANIYDDKSDGYTEDYPEIIVCNSYNLNCFNLNKANATPAQPYWWSLPTNDWSGFTGSTFYDFNGDGFSEIVYRDEEHIRILYGGEAPFPAGVDAERNWFKYPCGSITSDEYPIVADCDNDGEAEIIVTGYNFSGYNSPTSDYRGRVQVYESDAEPWTPCRNIWHQYNYFIVNINDNYGIPANQQAHHYEFPMVGSGNRPFNKYLAQRQRLNEDFQPFLPVPDATAQTVSVECISADSITVGIEICNDGSNRIKAGVPIAIYDGDPSTTAAQLYDNLHFIPYDIPIDSCFIFEISIATPPAGLTLFGVVNDNGGLTTPFDWATDFPSTTQPECFFPNNLFEFDFSQNLPPFEVSPDSDLCPSESTILEVLSTHLSYTWSDGTIGNQFVATGPGTYWVEVEDACQLRRIDTILIVEKILDPIVLPAVEVCDGFLANLIIDSTYQNPTWSQSGNPLCSDCSAFSFTPNQSTTLDISASQNGCPVDGTVQIQVNPPPDLSLSSVDGACDGTSAQAIVAVNNAVQPLTYLWSSGATTDTSIETQTGTAEVTVTDGNGCFSTGTVPVDVGLALVVEADFAPIQCAGGQTNINLNTLSGTTPVNFLWQNGNTNASLSGISNGNYDVTATDAAGCIKILNLTINEPPQIETDTALAHIDCFGEMSGSIEIDAQGGTAPLNFTWSDGPTNEDRINLAAGNYTVTVTDANGCTKQLDAEIIQPLPLLTLNADSEPTCPNTQNGTLNFAGASQGTPPYSYAWSNGDSLLALNNLAANSYAVTVTDAKGCTAETSFDVAAIDQPILDNKIEDVLCFGNQTGSIDITQLSGANDANFSWSNGISTPNNPNLPAGTYELTVDYGNGKCSFIESYIINEPPALAFDTTVSNVACFGDNSGAILFNPSGGTNPYTYLWNDGNTDQNRIDIGSGSYALTLTDENGCSETFSTQITEPQQLLTLGGTTLGSCPNLETGQVTFDGAQQGTPPYSYLWSNGSTDLILQNVAVGTYLVTMTDANACTREVDFIVGEIPIPVLEEDVENILCFGNQTGSIDITQLSGANDANFSWSNGISTPNNPNLPAGSYELTVDYGNGKCAFTESYAITEPPLLEASTGSSPAACFEIPDGSINLDISGGTPGSGYTILWSNGSTNQNLIDVIGGTYTVTVTDENACSTSLTETVDQPDPILVLDANTTPTCPNITNGTLTFSGANQGTAPYQFNWSNGGTGTDLVDLAFGDYTVTVTDANGCTAERTFAVPILDAIILDTLVQQISCFGAGDGSISVLQTGGASDAAFIWQNGTSNLQLSGLDAGNFTLEATYGNGICEQEWPFEIIEPPLLVLDAEINETIKCFGDETGSILTTVAGGTPTYTFNWSNGQGTADLQNLAAGTYDLLLSDANGCTQNTQIEITQPPLLTHETMFTADTCEANTGMVAVNAEGGTGDFSYKWNTGTGNATLTNLSPGDFDVTISDANGCTNISSITVPQYGTVPTVTSTDDLITCDHPTATISSTADQTNLSYLWQGPDPDVQNTANFTTAYAGTYNLLITNPFGCTAEVSTVIEIDTILPLLRLDDSKANIPCGEDSTWIRVLDVSTGNEFVSGWSIYKNGILAQTSTDLEILTEEAGIFIFSIKNTNNGCVKSDTLNVQKAEPLSVIQSNADISCFGKKDGTATIQVLSGGILPYEYALNNGNWTDSPYFTNLDAGNYLLSVRDAGDCFWETRIELSQPDSIAVALTVSDTFVYLNTPITLTATPYPSNLQVLDISWTPFSTLFMEQVWSQRDIPIQDTTYTVTIIDNLGCIAEDRVRVEVDNIDIYAPNIIHPKDQNQRAFTLYTGEDISEIEVLRIYDRWGNKVWENRNFEPNRIDLGWNGTFRGAEMNPAVFAWYAEVLLANGELIAIKGDVTLQR